MARDEEFTQYVAVRGPALRRTAFLLTGDWHEAEDLTQTALAKLYVAWPRIQVEGADAYARTIVTRSLVDGRRRFWHRERPTSILLDAVATSEPVDDRHDLQNALATLSPSHRAVLVLRFWEDLSVEQVAAVLSVSTGTVKSRTSRALDQLRAVMGPEALLDTKELQS